MIRFTAMVSSTYIFLAAIAVCCLGSTVAVPMEEIAEVISGINNAYGMNILFR